MATDISVITSSVVFSGLASAAIVFLSKNWISERIRQSIAHEYQTKFESFKQSEDYRRKITFLKESKLHEERAQIVKRVYGEIVDAMDVSAKLVFHFNLLETHPEFFENLKVPTDQNPQKWKNYIDRTLKGSDEDRLAKDAQAKIFQAIAAFRKDRIYFDPTMAADIERCFNLVLIVVSQFSNVSYRNSQTFERVVADRVVNNWKGAIEASAELTPKIETSFREYLGVVAIR